MIANIEVLHNDGTLWATSLWVHPEYRGKHLASQLIKRLIQDWGGQDIYCQVAPYADRAHDNSTLSSIYTGFGFEYTSIPTIMKRQGKDTMIPSKFSADESTQPAETTGITDDTKPAKPLTEGAGVEKTNENQGAKDATPLGDHGVVHSSDAVPEKPKETTPQEHKATNGTETGQVTVPYGQAVDKPPVQQQSLREVDKANGVKSNVPPTEDNGLRITTEAVDSALLDGVVPVDSVPVDVLDSSGNVTGSVTDSNENRVSPKGMKKATADR